MFTRHLDQLDGIIFVTAEGLWDRAEIDHHYDQLATLVSTCRDAQRPVRVLVDLTRSERQGPDIEAYVREKVAGIYRSGDRVATLVVQDDRPYMRAALGSADFAIFQSRLAAEMWLMEPDLPRPA